METDFDAYANNYRDIINSVSRISGEEYEYFIKLRISLMKAQLAAKEDDPNTSPRPLSILDFGCGTGTTEITMKELFPGSKICGVDASRQSIAAAQRLGLANVQFVTSNKSTLPLADNSVDLIYCNGTFHHIQYDRHRLALQGLFSVLKKGGQIFIFENNPYNPLMMRAMRNNPFDRDANLIHPNYLERTLTNAGFQLNTTYYYFFFPRFLKFARPMEKHLRFIPLGAQYFVSATK
jgi:ubiquinone/menaquinone biosynthesis C-methylase UbiE